MNIIIWERDGEGPIGPFASDTEADSWIRNAASRRGITAEQARETYWSQWVLRDPMVTLASIRTDS